MEPRARESDPPTAATRRHLPGRRTRGAFQGRRACQQRGARDLPAASPPGYACGAAQQGDRHPIAKDGLWYCLDSSRRSRVVTIARFHYGLRTLWTFWQADRGYLIRNWQGNRGTPRYAFIATPVCERNQLLDRVPARWLPSPIVCASELRDWPVPPPYRHQDCGMQ